MNSDRLLKYYLPGAHEKKRRCQNRYIRRSRRRFLPCRKIATAMIIIPIKIRIFFWIRSDTHRIIPTNVLIAVGAGAFVLGCCGTGVLAGVDSGVTVSANNAKQQKCEMCAVMIPVSGLMLPGNILPGSRCMIKRLNNDFLPELNIRGSKTYRDTR